MDTIIVTCGGCGAKNRIPAKKQHLPARCGRCRDSIAIGAAAVPVRLGDADFQSFVNSAHVPVMVDFFAPTCGPCQALAPIIASLARRYLGRVVIAQLDTSQNPGTSAHYHIRGVPTLMFFENGEVIDQIVGAPPESDLVSRLDHLAGRS